MLKIKDFMELGIPPREARIIGPVQCMACGYCWIANRPTLTFLLECPLCYSLRAN